jgi:hypothetical protein
MVGAIGDGQAIGEPGRAASPFHRLSRHVLIIARMGAGWQADGICAQMRSRCIGGEMPMKRLVHRLIALISTLAVIAASACGPLPRLDAVPESEQGDVTVLGIKDVRYWGDEVTPQMIADGVAAFRREQAAAIAAGHPGPLPPAYYLAISGGGENGHSVPVFSSAGRPLAHDRPSSW